MSYVRIGFAIYWRLCVCVCVDDATEEWSERA